MSRYTLIDAIARHAENPDTFDVPNYAVIDRLTPGWFILIGVRFDTAAFDPADDVPVRDEFEIHRDIPPNRVTGERFWLKLTVVDHAAGLFTGTIDNDLVYTAHHGLRLGELLTVERRHILDTFRIN